MLNRARPSAVERLVFRAALAGFVAWCVYVEAWVGAGCAALVLGVTR